MTAQRVDESGRSASAAAAEKRGPFLKAPRGIYTERMEKVLDHYHFQNVNLTSKIYPEIAPAGSVQMSAYAVPDLKRIPFKEAILGEFNPVKVGDRFGPSWSTHWFKITCRVPAGWGGKALVFVFNAPSVEGLIFDKEGHPIHGITGGNWNDLNRRTDYHLTKSAKEGQEFSFYIELACNGLFGNGEGDMIAAPDENRFYSLQEAHLAVFDHKAYQFQIDFEIILGMAKELSNTKSQRGFQALYTGNLLADMFYSGKSFDECLKVSQEFLKVPAEAGSHEITSVGHCHIDTAWLWPYDETKRKVTRSWSTQLYLMDEYPEYKFVCSQAQQFEWLRKYHPHTFNRLKEKVENGQFIPIGGTWVEMDGNLPSGEAFSRQFLYGQRLYLEMFKFLPAVFWLPDTFGYSAQLPQLVKLAHMKYFFTQKLSWNNINVFEHTSFVWQALDGTGVLTHFCPANTYAGQVNVREVAMHLTNHKDLAVSNKSLYLYGNGDGGGGPTRDMLERQRRLLYPHGTAGLPTLKPADPTDFYKSLERDEPKLPRWLGELYFELHRGTYTSQASTKKGNRFSEVLMRNVELVWTLAHAVGAGKYPSADYDRLWKQILLNQFHDVLPGSSIEHVYKDAVRIYEDVHAEGSKLLTEGLDALLKDVETAECTSPGTGPRHASWVCLNPLSFERREIVEVPLIMPGSFAQISTDKEKGLALVSVDGHSLSTVNTMYTACEHPVTASQSEGAITLENAHVSYTFDLGGRLIEGFDKRAGRYFIRSHRPGNVFAKFSDVPLYWDAWDVEIYHLDARTEVEPGTCSLTESGPLRAALKITSALSETSKVEQRVYLTSESAELVFDTTIHWNEAHTMLKVEFPLEVHSDVATYEVPYGLVRRPTHMNTSWDLARFEVCGHKFADLSEYNFGVSLLSNCKYGFSCRGSVLAMSLLRSPKAPDAHCDIGKHTLKYALLPHASGVDHEVLRAGHAFTAPLVVQAAPSGFPANLRSTQFFDIEPAHVILDAVKIAEPALPGLDQGDGTPDDIVVRVYEALGGSAPHATLRLWRRAEKVWAANLLEEPIHDADLGPTNLKLADDGLSVTFGIRPFQVVTLRIKLAK